jgi:hypothetical protein
MAEAMKKKKSKVDDYAPIYMVSYAKHDASFLKNQGVQKSVI